MDGQKPRTPKEPPRKSHEEYGPMMSPCLPTTQGLVYQDTTWTIDPCEVEELLQRSTSRLSETEIPLSTG